MPQQNKSSSSSKRRTSLAKKPTKGGGLTSVSSVVKEITDKLFFTALDGDSDADAINKSNAKVDNDTNAVGPDEGKRYPGADEDGYINSQTIANHEGLNMPSLQLVHRIFQSDYVDGIDTEVPYEHEEKVLGLPGSLLLNAVDTNKYFGEIGRSQFFERFQWISKQRGISTTIESQEVDQLYFNNESDTVTDACVIPFAPSRESNRYTYVAPVVCTSSVTIKQHVLGDALDGKRLNATDEKAKKRMNFKIETNNKDVNSSSGAGGNSISTAVKSMQSVKQGRLNLHSDTEVFAVNSRNGTNSSNTKNDSSNNSSPNFNSVRSAASVATNDSSSNYESSDSYNVEYASYVEHELNLDLPASLTPRTRYLEGCAREKINPRASLLIRKKLTKSLNLQHFGIGDKMCLLLAESLADLSYISCVNVADNNLTDVSLGPLLQAVAKIESLIQLDVSQNTLGPVAAEVLSDYLIDPHCPLQKLIMLRADVDDFECERFVSSIMKNRSVTSLDLSYNKIGVSENLNTVMPDMVTGAESLAMLLEMDTCMLSTLSLSYNMIRLDGAVALATSVSKNRSITHLDLSFNSLGSDGGIALGYAIENNSTLQYVNVSNNALNSKAVIVIAAGLLENISLKAFIIDSNPIGVQGAKSLMMVPGIAGNRVKISAKKCNITIRDTSITFDSDKILHDFTFDMDDCYDRAVFSLLLYQIAGHHTWIISKCMWKNQDIGLKQIVTRERMEYFDEEQLTVTNNLRHLQAAASNIMLATNMFYEVDADGSDELEIDEFDKLLRSLGIEMNEDRLSEVMNEYDTDGGGTIGLQEFLLFLKKQSDEAAARLKDLEEIPVYASAADPHARYKPPTSGTMFLSVKDGFARKFIYRVVSSCDRNYINELAAQTGDAVSMASYSIKDTKVRLDEALNIGEAMLAESKGKVQVLTKLLPQANSVENARSLLIKVLKHNKMDMQQLRRTIGYAIKPILGVPDGYYCLDLSDEYDRICIIRLLEICQTNREKRRANSLLYEGAVGDLSQKCNWSCFRNEVLQGQPTVIAPEFASPLPTSGILQFDFVSTIRPTVYDIRMTDSKFLKLMLSTCLLRPSERSAAMAVLRNVLEYTDRVLDEGIYYDKQDAMYYECDKRRSVEIGNASAAFYSNINARQAIIEEYAEREEIRIDYSVRNPNDKGWRIPSVLDRHDTYYDHPHHVHRKRQTKPLGDVDQTSTTGSNGSSVGQKVPGRTDSVKDLGNDSSVVGSISVADGSQLASSETDEESDDSSSDDGDDAATLEGDVDEFNEIAMESKDDEFLQRYRNMLASPKLSIEAKASRIVEVICSIFEFTWLYCRHLQMILHLFYTYGHKRSSKYFGTYRVELTVRLFSRICDVHNFDMVAKVLTPFELGTLYCRIGWLTLWNPMKADGGVDFDLSRREERVLCKCIIQLSVNEPGDNMPVLSFRWERDKDPMPGYEVTQSWLTEEGMPMRGVWTCVYRTGKKSANLRLRKAMLQLVLIQEHELVEEAMYARTKPLIDVTVGEVYVKNNSSIFTTYLADHKVKKFG